MAFNSRMLGNVAVGPARVIMGYTTDDGVRAVIEPGYFDRARSTMREKDIIFAETADGAYMLSVRAIPKDRTQPVLVALVKTELPAVVDDHGLSEELEAPSVKTTRRRAA